MYHRHLNQRSPTELGTGCININDALTTKYLNTTQRVTVVNKGIKVGELKVTIQLGCDGIHFGKEFIGMYQNEIAHSTRTLCLKQFF